MSSLLNRPRRRPELNLVPLIDVLVMLIFFAFVTMQFKSATTLNITLAIDKDGTVSLNGKIVSDDELRGLLSQIHNVDEDIPVLIKADEVSQVKKLTFVWDACRAAGLTHVILQSR